MDFAGSISGEREFQNELSLASRIISAVGSPSSPFLVAILGYSSSSRGERKLLVYELMANGSLQDKLLDQKCAELSIWDKRFNIVLDIARALHYLHFNCGNTAVVHGDVKPSNVLLDGEFNAKLGDFGLARILDENENEKNDDVRVLLEVDADGGSNKVKTEEDNGSIIEETESVVTVDRSPAESNFLSETTINPVEASPSEGFERANSLAESWADKMSVESGGMNNINNNNCRKIGKKKGGGSGRDYWWWKQDNGGGNGCGSESGRVKDYVMEWIGNEIKKERPNCCDLATCNDKNNGSSKIEEKKHKKKKKKRWDWWASLDIDDRLGRKVEKNRKPREWWREEFCEELTKKNKKNSELWWQRDEDFIAPERKKKRRRKSRSSLGSIDWWLDGLSGELRSCRRNSLDDWGANGEIHIPKSGGISSTPSMRGTVCYIAPEYGGGGQLSEKCDVYSFGVLVLVIIAGRRPLQVTASPMSEFERANLVSWARQLAYNGKLLDLVDTSIESLDREQAMLCITIALLCIQRSPSKRPNMKEIVEMLTGEAEPPHLPFEFSPSPPSNFPFKSRKKVR